MELEELLGIKTESRLDQRARRLVESDERLLDELVGLRLFKGLTQSAIAERMQISQSAVARIESGERDPRLSTLRRYAMAVGALVEHDVIDDELEVVPGPGVGSHVDVAWDPLERGLVVAVDRP